jgi:hypothetical protein
VTELPNATAMNNNADTFGKGLVLPFSVVTAICVGAKAKKRKRKVPKNSPTMAIKWFLMEFREPIVQFPREWGFEFVLRAPFVIFGIRSILREENGEKSVEMN